MHNIAQNKRDLTSLCHVLLKHLDSADASYHSPEHLTDCFISSALSSKIDIVILMQFISVFAMIDFKKDNFSSLDYYLDMMYKLDPNPNAVSTLLHLLKEKKFSDMGYHIAHHGWGIQESTLSTDWRKDPHVLFMSYAEDQSLKQQVKQLATLPEESLGHCIYKNYLMLKQPLPGERGGLYFSMTIPHDTLHVLTGYSASMPLDELFLSGFTMGLLSSRAYFNVMTVILLFYNAIPMFTSSSLPTLEHFPLKAWIENCLYGLQMNIDLFNPTWDFWQDAHVSVSSLRERYQVTSRVSQSLEDNLVQESLYL